MSLDKAEKLNIDASKYKFAVVASRYNESLVEAMLNDVKRVFAENGVAEDSVKIIRVPGAMELPTISASLALQEKYDAIINLGVVIAGDTSHHDIIAHCTANAFQKIAIECGIAVINGVIVTNTKEQAEIRTIGSIARGVEFANAAIEMAETMSLIREEDC